MPVSRSRFRILALALVLSWTGILPAQDHVLQLTLPMSIDLAFRQGYAAQNASSQYRSTKRSLEAELRRMRTSVSLSLSAPNYSESLSNQFDPGSGQYQYYQIQTMQVQGGMTVTQPLTFTGGSLSLQEQLISREQRSGLTGSSTYRHDYFNTLQLQYRQPLLTPNTYAMTEERNRISDDQARADFIKSQLDVEYTVTEAFYSVYRLQRQYEIIQEQVHQNEDSYETAKGKFNSGLVPEVDYLQSEVDLATSRNDLLTAERDLNREVNALRLLVGLSTEQRIDLVADPQYTPVAVNRETAIAKALLNRSEVLRAQRTIDLRKLDIRTAEARSDLRIDLTASYGLNGAKPEFSQLWSDYGISRGAAMTISVPLFDWGSGALDVEAAQVQHENAVLTYENTRQTVRHEILDLLSRIQLAESRIHVLEKVVAVAQKGYDISVERFKTGMASRNDLAQSQQRLTNAKLNSLNALTDYLIALADLRRQTLWDFERNEQIRPVLRY